MFSQRSRRELAPLMVIVDVIIIFVMDQTKALLEKLLCICSAFVKKSGGLLIVHSGESWYDWLHVGIR